MRTHAFIVEGPRGSGFPLDMLRHDEAWPEGSADAELIRKLLAGEIEDLPRRVRVRLRTAFHAAPTRGRWMSFAWEAGTEPWTGY